MDFHYEPGLGSESYDKGELVSLHLRVQRFGTTASLRVWQRVACEAHTELSWQYPLASDDYDEIIRCLAPSELWSSRVALLDHFHAGLPEHHVIAMEVSAGDVVAKPPKVTSG